uniref:Ras association domain family member 1 n=1 Tax=Scleropages formosus TaxID=113540 RepID=A0A8D0CI70_SCLFO
MPPPLPRLRQIGLQRPPQPAGPLGGRRRGRHQRGTWAPVEMGGVSYGGEWGGQLFNGNVVLCTHQDELVDWRTQEMSFAQVHQKVKEYNAQVCSDLHMNPDGSFTGFIEVRIKLVRPVCILFAHRAPATGLRCRTSLHLPRDMGKQLHVSSSTRAHDIVQALLSNVGVLDDPGTFALFERSERDGQVHLRRLADTERPLLLRLCVGPSETDMSLVLKEKSDVNWEAFSEPELHNFLRMLQREEEEHVKRVAERYARVRDRLQGALAQTGGGSGQGGCPPFFPSDTCD